MLPFATAGAAANQFAPAFPSHSNEQVLDQTRRMPQSWRFRFHYCTAPIALEDGRDFTIRLFACQSRKHLLRISSRVGCVRRLAFGARILSRIGGDVHLVSALTILDDVCLGRFPRLGHRSLEKTHKLRHASSHASASSAASCKPATNCSSCHVRSRKSDGPFEEKSLTESCSKGYSNQSLVHVDNFLSVLLLAVIPGEVDPGFSATSL